jgi:hypothetical protein
MRSGIGNSPTDPLFVSQTSATGVSAPAGTVADPEYVRRVGSASIATNQVGVTTAATLIAAARAGRQSIVITLTAATVLYIGGSGVTAANGLYVAGVVGQTITLETAAAVYGIVGAGTLTVSYLENF